MNIYIQFLQHCPLAEDTDDECFLITFIRMLFLLQNATYCHSGQGHCRNKEKQIYIPRWTNRRLDGEQQKKKTDEWTD